MAENNHQRRLSLRAPRGVLFDRDGTLLVENRDAFTISILREHSANLDQTIRRLAAATGVDEQRMRETIRAAPRRTELPAHRRHRRRDAGAGVGGAGAASRLRAAGRRRASACRRGGTRRRGWPRTCSATSARSARRRWRPTACAAASVVGQSGVEKAYNRMLMGTDGERRVMVNSVGREITTLDEVPAVEGPAGPADDRPRPAAGRRGRVPRPRLRGRGGVPRPAQRRGARAGQPAGLRPERLRGGHRSGDLEPAQHRPAAAAAEPRDPGPLLAGLDLQGRGGRRRRSKRASSRPTSR